VPESSKTVRNALTLLSCFSRQRPVLNTSELARQLKLARTSVMRLLVTLEACGFVERLPAGGGYRIGLRAFEIGTLFLAANPLSFVLLRALDELVANTQCTAYFAILDADDVVILNYREGTLPIRFIWQVGDRLPCHTTALGKAMLAHMSPEEIERHIGKRQQLRGLTARSIRTRTALLKEIEKTRERGWGVAHEESHAGLTAVGSAILDEAGRPIAAISISCLDYPPNPERLKKYAAVVQRTARDVSRQIAEYKNYGLGMSPDAWAIPPKVSAP
jgi:DNA-binding IclR family transcriptional regulator